MVRAFRYVNLALIGLFGVALVVQVFLAGLGLFGGAENFNLHREVGYWLSVIPVLILVAAAVARAGRRTLLLTFLLAVAAFIQPIFPLLTEPALAALHPVNALLIFWLTIVVFQRALAVVRAQAAGPAGPTEGAAAA
jgi:hypothetical protein